MEEEIQPAVRNTYVKAIYAAVIAALLAAQAIYVDNVALTILLAALLPLGVYIAPK